MVIFIMHKKFATVFTFMKRTQERHVELCNCFCTSNQP
jgi:hypothetical protein